MIIFREKDFSSNRMSKKIIKTAANEVVDQIKKTGDHSREAVGKSVDMAANKIMARGGKMARAARRGAGPEDEKMSKILVDTLKKGLKK